MIVAATLENADIALSGLQSLIMLSNESIVPIYATIKAFKLIFLAFDLVTEILNLSQE